MTPIVLSPRLVLRPICDDDLIPLHKGINTPEIAKWMINTIPVDYDGVEYWIRNVSDRNIYWSIRDRDTFIMVGCLSLDWREEEQAYEIGWWLLPEFWHRGFAVEAVHHMLFWAVDSLKGNKLIGIVASDNLYSIRALERVGFKSVRPTTYCKEDGSQTYDAILYELQL